MHSWLWRPWLCVFTTLLCVGFSVAADLESAKRAYERKDYATAFKEFTALAEQGNAEAQVNLGRMYMKGEGVLKDPDQANKWFKASAEQGNADAQFSLGAPSVLRHVDIPEGLKWLRLSAEQGNQDAQLLLGKSYAEGLPGVSRDPIQGDMWLRLAAKDNLPFYQAQLEDAERNMTAGEVAKGKALAAAWKPKHGLKPEEKPPRDEKVKAARKPGS